MQRSRRGLEMYVVAKRTTGTWSDEERFALVERFKSLPRLPLPRIQTAQQYLIVPRPCYPSWIRSAVRADMPYHIRRELVVSLPMLGLPRLPSGEPDVQEIIRRFEEKLKEPARVPKKPYTRVILGIRAVNDEKLRALMKKLGVALYRHPETPREFVLAGIWDKGVSKYGKLALDIYSVFGDKAPFKAEREYHALKDPEMDLGLLLRENELR